MKLDTNLSIVLVLMNSSSWRGKIQRDHRRGTLQRNASIDVTNLDFVVSIEIQIVFLVQLEKLPL